MSEITRDDVAYIARLANLALDDEEVRRLAVEMRQILSYVEKLNELDTSDIEPMMHVLPLTNVLRDDHVGQSLNRDTALANAPASDGEYFLVPRILDTESG